jgi:hypothetical protein
LRDRSDRRRIGLDRDADHDETVDYDPRLSM